MKRTFTKYPQSYVKASKEVSAETFDQLVDAYKDSGLGWSRIVAELKADYGLDLAKEVADSVCYERKNCTVESATSLDAVNWYAIWNELQGAKLTVANFANDDIIWDTYSKADSTGDASKSRQIFQAVKQFKQALTEAVDICNRQIQGIDKSLYTEIGYSVGEDEQYNKLGD